MNQLPPADFNPHVHHRAPSTRVELLAWRERHSGSYDVRISAAAILCNAGISRSMIYPCPLRKGLRRITIARHAHALRRMLRERRQGFGCPATLKAAQDDTGARMEAQVEGRMMPAGRPNFHD